MYESKLTVLIPVYNERFTVEELVEAVCAAKLQEGVSKEIIIVDDASTDGTAALLADLAAEHSDIILLRHEENRGKGAAVRTGISHATGDYVVIQDADLEYDPDDYSRLLAPLLEGVADAVYGSRFMPHDRKRALYFWHSLGNRFLTFFSNMFTNLDLTDMETCFKMIRGSILRSIPIRSDRFGFEPEITAKLAKRGCRIYEVPISYSGRSYQEGKKITWWDGIKALALIVYFWIVDDLYNERYGHDILHALSRTHRLNRWMADTIRPWVGQNVLEIGAGLGNITMQLLPRLSYTVSDMDSLHVEYLQSRFAGQRRIDVTRLDLGNEDEFRPLAECFDTVVCLNVVEHVADDDRALRNIRGALETGGRACILVPQDPSLYGTFDGVLGHHRRYTSQELHDKLESAGLVVEELFQFNRIAVPGWYLNGKILGRKRFGAVQLKIYDSLVWLWRRVDRFLPWQGVSLIAIATRPE